MKPTTTILRETNRDELWHFALTDAAIPVGQAMLFLGSTPVGGPIVGWVSDVFGARYAIGLGSVAALAAGAWGYSKGRSHERPNEAEPLAPDCVEIVDDELAR